MASSDALDFSSLFKLEPLILTEAVASCFQEVGLKRLVALATPQALELICFTATGDRTQKTCNWDFDAHFIQCMCVEPSGTWLLVASESALSLVPLLPQLQPEGAYDRRWSLAEVTHRPLACGRVSALAWWLTRYAENIAVVAQESGTILFYSLDSEEVVKETEVPGRITDAQICVDDSLDIIVLLITGAESQHWKLVLEHRSAGYSWAQGPAGKGSGRMREGLMAYIKDSVFPQGSSQETTAVTYSQKPTVYLPAFRQGPRQWSLSVQYVNGRHFITAFDVEDGTMILEGTEAAAPSRTLRARPTPGARYRAGAWGPRLLYLLADGALEVHSAALSVVQEGARAPRDTRMWRAELAGGGGARAHVLGARAARAAPPGWREPTFLCDLRLPRFALEPCLLLAASGAYLLSTVAEPCEWLVGLIMRGGHGAERAAAALGAPVGDLLCAAADMLLSRSKLQPAQYLYSLSQGPPDGWVARLGVFGRWPDLAAHAQAADAPPLGGAATTLRVIGQLLAAAVAPDEHFELDTQCSDVTAAQLEDICQAAGALGLWRALPMYSTERGAPRLLLAASRRACAGAVRCLLAQRHLLPCLLEEDSRFLLRYLRENCHRFDTRTLKRICLWLSPLREEVRPVLRDLRDGRTNVYTSHLVEVIGAFARLLAEVDARRPPAALLAPLAPPAPPAAGAWREPFAARRAVSGGLAHWAAAGGGAARVLLAETPLRSELLGRALGVACGRHHTVVLTENGVYCAGDNSHGQLGGGAARGRAAGDGARAGGAALRALAAWGARVVAVAAGHYHSAAVDAGGRLYTWGWGVHGQLGLGNTDDAWEPQLVTRLQGRKVTSVGCGACHTVALMRNGEVWACGAGMFGQLGGGGRGKSSVPVRISLLPEPAVALAVGYFHNLALSERGEVWVWGASPQCVRAAATHARRAAADAAADADPETHLRPAPLDADCGRIVQMAAGWHHSCLLNEFGDIFTWGLNFDGQLGTGDRKQVLRPTKVKLSTENAPLNTERIAYADVVTAKPPPYAGMVACGGEFTIFVDRYDNIFIAGNTHEPGEDDTGKQSSRVIMMKTTRRVIKIPANRSNNKFRFQFVDKFSSYFTPKEEDLKREMIPIEPNPLTRLSDFENENLIHTILDSLKTWIDKDDVASNPNMSAKLAFHNKNYSECLKFQLESIKTVTTFQERAPLKPESSIKNDVALNIKREKRKNSIINVIGKNIKDIGLAILNEQPYPDLPKDLFKSIPCSCEEIEPTSTREPIKIVTVQPKEVLARKAAQVIDNALKVFPANSDAWEEYLCLARGFYVENSLPGRELELVLNEYTEGHATMLASALMFSEDCAIYSEILTPKFYLTMCSKLLDTWG